jgi:hypothetical protein
MDGAEHGTLPALRLDATEKACEAAAMKTFSVAPV